MKALTSPGCITILRNILTQQGDAIDQWLSSEGDQPLTRFRSTLRDRARAVAESQDKCPRPCSGCTPRGRAPHSSQSTQRAESIA